MQRLRVLSRRIFVAALAATCGCAPGVDPAINTVEADKEPAKVETPVVVATLDEPDDAEADALKSRIELAVDHVRKREMRTTNAFWTVFHGILAFGDGLTLLDDQSNTRVRAIDYILAGDFSLGEIRGMRFFPTQYGVDVQMGPTFVGQGHQDQFIAILAQWNIPKDRKMYIYGKEYTLDDFVTQVEAAARKNQELSWTIVTLGKYRSTDYEWVNNAGEKLHYNDLIRSELDASIVDAACGGTHRLGGLAWALNRHLGLGGKKTELWQEVEDKVIKHQQFVKEHQSPDGHFSTNYFRGPGADPDIQVRLSTHGHQFEFLAGSLSDEQLREDWMRDAANALSMLFLEAQSTPVESGGLYHAAHGMVVYYERVYGWANAGKSKGVVSAKSEPAVSAK